MGQWVLEQRQRSPAVPWKVLMRQTGLSRATLNRYANACRQSPTLEVVAQQVVASIKTHLTGDGIARVEVNGETIAVMMDIDVG